MIGMFSGCSSLTKIDLSKFNTRNNTGMRNIFNGCSSLKKKNVITNDEKILQEISI